MLKLQFSVRMFLLLTVTTAVVLTLLAPRFQPNSYQRSIVRTQAEFDQRCQNGNCLVFKSPVWSVNCMVFRKLIFEGIASDGYTFGNFKPTVIEINNQDSSNAISEIIGGETGRTKKQSLFKDGVLIWMRNGKAVDQEWISTFFGETGKDSLRHRSAVNFSSH